MTLTLNELTKDISTVEVEEILSDWKWKVADVKEMVVISSLGDLFFVGQDDAVYSLRTDDGDVTKAANNLDQFVLYLNDESKIDECFFLHSWRN